MDLKKLDLAPASERGAVMRVRDPITGEDLMNDDGSFVEITLFGPESRNFRRKVDQVQRTQQRQRKRGNEMGLAEAERQNSELLAAATKDWSGIQWEGEVLECNTENAEMLYRELGWLRQQVDEFVGDAANFFKRHEKI